MKLRYLTLAGAIYGVAMRGLFALKPFEREGGPMMAAFVVFLPLAIGFFTAHGQHARRPGFASALLTPWLPTLCFIGGTALLLLEGSICIAMALPILLALASLGGAIGWCVARLAKPRTDIASVALVLPLVAGVLELDRPLPDQLAESRAAIVIAAPPSTVWREINHATRIEHSEMAAGWAWRIGVPSPLEAVTRESAGQRTRQLKWHGGVSFDEPITDWQPERHIAWRYVFTAASFPPDTLDEHVLIGGRHFDLVDTDYTLAPEGRGTRLSIVVHYRVSTRFNWYAAALGRWLVDDSARTILKFYKTRTERPAG